MLKFHNMHGCSRGVGHGDEFPLARLYGREIKNNKVITADNTTDKRIISKILLNAHTRVTTPTLKIYMTV